MKIKIIQPLYSKNYSDSDELFLWELRALDECESGLDLIVMPESCDVPAFAKTRDEMLASVEKYCEPLRKKASETAIRTNALVVINIHYPIDGKLRNSTLIYDREGKEAARYDKQHLTPGEVGKMKLDSAYTYEFAEPYVVELEGVRYAFLTCYDFYFYEMYAAIARRNVDIIIGCSHQRTDSYDTLSMLTSFCAYHTNAYVLRSSVSMGDEGIGGCSMAVAPSGRILHNLYGKVGAFTVDIDPKEKFSKPAGFGGDLIPHYEYIERGRRPWKYRPSGPFISKSDKLLSYPRTCAHRGLNTDMPENSLPSFAAAIALGAEEIEFDLWETLDGEIVSIHDSTLDRVSDGKGLVYEHTYEELLSYDFGFGKAKVYRGLRIPTFEEILHRFTSQVIMNVHVKTRDDLEGGISSRAIDRIISLIRRFDAEKHVYIMCGDKEVLKQFKKRAPDIPVCKGAGKAPWQIVDDAIEIGAEKVQLFRPYFNREMIEKAHAHGIICNVFYSDDEESCREYLDMGVDTVLTNDYLKISKIVNEYKTTRKE